MFYAQAQAILDGQTLPTGWELAGGPDEVAAVASDLLILATFAQVCPLLAMAITEGEHLPMSIP